MISLTVLFVLFVCCESVKLPANFKKCNRKDPKWKECVLEAGSDAISQLTRPFPEVNLPNLEPLVIQEVNVGTATGGVSLTQNYKNLTIFGLTGAKLEKLEFNFHNKSGEISGVFPELKVTARYKVDGKFLLLKISGEGPGEATLRDVKFHSLTKYEEIKKEDKTYVKIVSASTKITPGLIVFQVGTNIFSGDNVVGEDIIRVMNENWDVLYEDLEGDYTKVVNEVCQKLANHFFEKISIEEAFD